MIHTIKRYPFTVIMVSGCMISLLSLGVRASFGLFLDPISSTHGWGRDVFAFALAMQNLMWGLGQPLAGVIADRYGSGRVLAVGALIYASGVALMSISSTPFAITATAGFMIGIGIAGASFAVVLAAVTKLVPAERSGWALGMVTAAGSLGQFLVVPLGQALIGSYGWIYALLMLSLVVSLMIALSRPLRTSTTQRAQEQSLFHALREAGTHRGYWFLLSGFFVCGFHVAFIQTHLPAYLSDNNMPAHSAAWALAIIGLFNIIGAYSAGVLGERYRRKNLLSIIYLARSGVIAAFVIAPLTLTSAYLFAAAIGLLWLSTVPLTSGIVAHIFGTRYLGTLFGVVFLSHQIGAFIGVWLGGFAYDKLGSYDIVWWIGIVLGLFAAVINLPINDQEMRRLETQT